MHFYGFYHSIFIFTLFYFTSSKSTANFVSILYTKYFLSAEEEMPSDERIALRRRLTGELMCQLGDELVERIANRMAQKIEENVKGQREEREKREKGIKEEEKGGEENGKAMIIKKRDNQTEQGREREHLGEKSVGRKGISSERKSKPRGGGETAKEEVEKLKAIGNEKGKQSDKKERDKGRQGKGKKERAKDKKKKAEDKKEVEKKGMEEKKTVIDKTESGEGQNKEREFGEMGGQNGGEKESESSGGMEEKGLRFLDFFANLEKENAELNRPIKGPIVREADICQYRAFYAYLKFVLGVIEGGKMPKATGDNNNNNNWMTECWKVLATRAEFQRDDRCDRIDQIIGDRARDRDQTAEQKWLQKFEQDIAIMHQLNLHRLLKGSASSSNRKVANLFEMKPGEEENWLMYCLRMLALSSSKENGEQMGRRIRQRLLELVGGQTEMVDQLVQKWPVLTGGIVLLEWLQFFYTKALLADSEPTRQNAIIKANVFAYIERVDEFHRRNGRIGNDWAQVRGEIGTMMDNDTVDGTATTGETGKKRDHLSSKEVNSWLGLLYWLRKELNTEQYTALNSQQQQKWWTVRGLSDELKRHTDGTGNGGAKASKLMAEVRADLMEVHFENLDRLIEQRVTFRQTLQEMSGVHLVRRLSAIFVDSSAPAKIVPLIRKCRQREGVTKWFLAVQKPTDVDQCPSSKLFIVDPHFQYRDPDADSVGHAYAQLLSSSDSANNTLSHGPIEFAARDGTMPVTVDASLWLFSALVDDLLVFLEALFALEAGAYRISSGRDTVVRELWTAWTTLQLLLGQNHANWGPKVKLCRVYCFFDWALRKVWPCLSREEGNDLWKFVDNIYWDRFASTSLLKKIKNNWRNGAAQGPICDQHEADQLFSELTRGQKIGLLHTRAIYTLIKRRTKSIVHFFCSKDQLDELLITKERLLLLIRDTARLDWLELMLPEILQIDVISDRLRVALYQCLLVNRSMSPLARRAEARIVVPLLYDEVNRRYGQRYAECTVQQIMEDDEVETVWGQLWARIYTEMDTMAGICLTMFILMFTDGLVDAFPSDQQLQNCVDQGARLKPFQRYWQLIERKHFDFLHRAIFFVFPVGELPGGAKRRLAKVMGTEIFGKFWDKFGDRLTDSQMFVNDLPLMDHYLATLSPELGPADHFAHRMAAHLCVFVRFIDAEPRGAKFDKIWHEKKAEQLAELNDHFFEAAFDDEFRAKMHFVWRLFEGIRSVLISVRFLGVEKMLRREWEGMEKRAQRETDNWRARTASAREKGLLNRAGSDIGADDDGTMPSADHWMTKLHWAALQKLAFDNAKRGAEAAVFAEQFRRRLRTELRESVSAQRQLLNFLGINDIKELLEGLGIKFDAKAFENDPMEIEGEEEIRCSDQGEKRKKKKSRKRGKKKKSEKAAESVPNGGDSREGSERAGESREESENGEESVLNGESREGSEKAGESVSNGESREGSEKEGESVSNGEGQEWPKETDQKPTENGMNNQQQTSFGTEMGLKSAADGEIADQNLGIDEYIGVDLLLYSKGEELREKLPKLKILDLKDDKFLVGKYLEVMADPNKFSGCPEDNNVECILLDLGVFANEISRRIETMRQFEQNAKHFENLKLKFPKRLMKMWKKLEEEGQIEMEMTKMGSFREGLSKMLREILRESEGESDRKNGNKSDQKNNKAKDQQTKMTTGQTDRQNRTQSDRKNDWRTDRKKSQRIPSDQRHKPKKVNSSDQQNKTEKRDASSANSDQRASANGRDQTAPEQHMELLIGMRDQLHRHNFARLISGGGDEMARGAWANLTDSAQFAVVAALTAASGARGKRAKKYSNCRTHFLKYVAKWERARAHAELDGRLFSKFSQENKLPMGSKQILGMNFVQNMQQIKFKAQTDDAQTNSLINVLRENGFYGIEKAKEKQINEEMERIRETVTKWSNGTGTLLLGGSSMLGVQTADSDIDTICIVPEHIRLDAFFGTLPCPGREEKERQKCDDNSLFCMLCQLAEFASVRAIVATSVPLVRLISARGGHHFDIVFASVPPVSVGQVEGNAEAIGQMAHRLATTVGQHNLEEEQTVQIERMTRSLAGYHANLTILGMVPNIDTFRTFVLTLKMWSKRMFIYNNVLGFLHGMSLYILAAKICIMYPNGTVPFLVRRFFLTYSLWEWPFPVQLGEVRPNLLAWSAEKEQLKRLHLFGVGTLSPLSMPIISPGFPEQNAAFNINLYTAKIIEKAMREALEQLWDDDSARWEQLLLQKRTFSDMYEHSFAIECSASSWELCEEFCAFVGTRIRVQLTRSGACVRRGVNFCHARAVVGCPLHILSKYKAISPGAACMVWLVGIDLEQSGLSSSAAADRLNDNVAFLASEQFNRSLRADIVYPIVASYRRVVLGELPVHQQQQADGGDDDQQKTKQRTHPSLNVEAKKIQNFFEKHETNFDVDAWQRVAAEFVGDFVHLDAMHVDREQLRREWRE